MQEKSFDYITAQRDLAAIIADIKKQQFIGLDIESTGLDFLLPTTKILLVQLEVGGNIFVIDARKVDVGPLREVFENPRYIKTIQNALFEFKAFYARLGIVITGIYDTKIVESLLNAGLSKGGTGLRDLVKKYANVELDKSTRNEFIGFPDDDEFTEKQLRYAADDVVYLSLIRNSQQTQLDTYGLNKVAGLEFSVVEPVAKMELAGIRLDADRWRISLTDVKQRLFKVTQELMNVLPDPPPPLPKPIKIKKDGTPYKNSAKVKPVPILNLGSWQQLAWACDQIGINLTGANKKTKKGLTNVATIQYAQKITADAWKKEILGNIVKYRQLNQIKKTFGENLINWIKDDGRIHAQFHQNGTAAGRFSSSGPNLQNIQKKGEEGKILRSCFIPKDGCKFIIADYGQLHLRIASELSGDPVMTQILENSSGDLHKGTASQMFGVPYDQVTDEQRGMAKALNFGIIYGMGIMTLADRLGCTRDKAETLYNTYTDTYKVLMEWINKEGATSWERGYARAISGRMRWFPALDSEDKDFKKMKSFYNRVGKNHPMIATDGDMLKTSMVFLCKPLERYSAQIVNIIHDEICIEVPDEYAIEVARVVRRKMILAGRMFLKSIPITVEIKVRDCWYKDDENETDALLEE